MANLVQVMRDGCSGRCMAEKLYRTGNAHVRPSRRCRFSLAGYQATRSFDCILKQRALGQGVPKVGAAKAVQ
jgi:hypothetical protein